MASQQSIILGALIKKLKETQAPEKSEDSFFELFVNEQVLKEYDLSYDELIEGNIGNGGDGGIDGIFIFVNNYLLQPDTELSDFKRNVNIEVHILQAKNNNSFDESVIQKFCDSSEDMFNLDISLESLKTVYNNDLLRFIKLFRDSYLELIDKQPILSISYYYGSKGDEIHNNVNRKTHNLEATVKKFFPKSKFNFTFLTAEMLLEKSRKDKKANFNLQLSESAITTAEGGYVCISGLKSYYEFITDDNDEIVKHIFDANVRDHQKSTTVNKEISVALNSANPEDFWWLNNGITILSDKANLSGKILTIQDPQIVNGCQTSFEIFNFFKVNKRVLENETRSLMVRVIQTSDDAIKSRIIKSTNSQTSIPAASLRSTDLIHRNIEQYFENNGLYYDRRKNFWKNQDKPIESIVTIPYLSQTLMAMLLRKPDTARARPSTLIKDDSEYYTIFNDKYHLDTFLKAIILQKRIEKELTKASYFDRGDSLNVRWFVSMMVVINKLEKPIHGGTNHLRDTEKFNAVDWSLVTAEQIQSAILQVYNVYKDLGGTDTVAKSRLFTEKLIEICNNSLLEV